MIRNLLIFGVSLACALGSLVAAAATATARDFDLRGYADPLEHADLPFRVPRLGVNVELAQYAPDELERHLDLMEQAGVHWLRQVFPWDAIEPEPGRFDWAKWDAIVAAVGPREDLELVAVLFRTPGWAGSRGTGPTAPPDDPADFAAFAAAVAGRYGDAIDYYQIWDEPNLTDAWGGLEPRAADYLAMLRAAYRTIHAADAWAMVIAAALAPTTEQGPDNVSDWRYLADLYALGGASAFDAAAAKPYGFNTGPNDRQVDEYVLNFSRIVRLREIMVAHGDGHKTLWASNWGWNSLPDNWQGAPSIWGAVTAADRTTYTLAALDRVEREWPWLGGLILHHWQPDALLDDPIWGFALLDANGEPSPLLNALIERKPPAAAANGRYPAANPYARYSGVWTFSELGADIGWIQDSQFEFTFTGRDVGLLLREDDYVAYLYATVDGQPANALPRDAAGNAYVVLTSGSLLPELNLVPVAGNLTPGTHRLHVVADRGSDRWALAGFAVSDGNLRTPYERQIAVALVAAAISGLAAVVSGWLVEWGSLLRPVAGLGARLGDAAQIGISAATSLALLAGMLLTWNDATPNLFRREPVQLGLALLSAGLIYVEPGLILTIAAVLVLFVIFFHRQDLGLMLVVFWSPFFLFPVELYRFAFPMSELLLLILLPAWALRGLAGWGAARQTSVSQFSVAPLTRFRASVIGLDYAMLCWLALGAVSLLWAERRGPAATELRTLILEPALLYALLRTSRLGRAGALRLADSLVAAGVVVAIVGFALFLRGEAIITAEEGARRLASVYGSPNNVGLFLGRCIPFALAFALIPIARARRWLAAAGLAIMLMAALLTQSAGALVLGLPAAIAAVFLLALRRRAWLPLTALFAAGAAIMALALQTPRFARLLDFGEGTNFYRLRVWQSALAAISDRPLTGLGLDQFLYAFRGRYILPDAWQEPDLSHPHNFLLDFWVRLGVAGVVLFIWLQMAFWRTALKAYRHFRVADSLLFAPVVGLMGSMVNLLAHGLVDNSVFVNDLSLVFALQLGLAATLANEVSGHARTPESHI